MPVTALVVACVGPMCAYSAPDVSFDSVAQCERAAPAIAGLSRASMTNALWDPSSRTERTAFQCIDSATGKVLLSFDSEEAAHYKLIRD
ncbi:hypothetical protein [Magnetospirillum sp. 64-120]|uniref:hypothetical protein n=1 Tax=Magnetospirillum sp. 64-120 TaxID=1895778 RepID=UPI000925A3E7|nr:hypothetical protein [Magnetospirillum sp. 64-120]OJX68639.1 MAG: hypothetical protein BGO92_19695 [Magnetospirillum sp. 64-120]